MRVDILYEISGLSEDDELLHAPPPLQHHPQDVRRTRSEIALFRDDQARNWLQRCVILFCQERGLQYVQVCCGQTLEEELVSATFCGVPLGVSKLVLGALSRQVLGCVVTRVPYPLISCQVKSNQNARTCNRSAEKALVHSLLWGSRN